MTIGLYPNWYPGIRDTLMLVLIPIIRPAKYPGTRVEQYLFENYKNREINDIPEMNDISEWAHHVAWVT